MQVVKWGNSLAIRLPFTEKRSFVIGLYVSNLFKDYFKG